MRYLKTLTARHNGDNILSTQWCYIDHCIQDYAGSDLMKNLIALFCGSLFGMGLFISGMTDTTKVQGWLDIFGNWDPTLAFVLGGAIVPMSLTWRLSKKIKKPIFKDTFPEEIEQKLDKPLIVGSIFFWNGLGTFRFMSRPSNCCIGFWWLARINVFLYYGHWYDTHSLYSQIFKIG